MRVDFVEMMIVPVASIELMLYVKQKMVSGQLLS